MFQGSSTPASLSIFSILSAIRFFSMMNLIRGVLRGENQVRINQIKNMRFPEMHIYSILLISMASSDMPLEFDSGKLQNPKYPNIEIPIPSEKVYGKGIISEYNRLGSRNHPLKKLGSCNVGLSVILSSPFDNIIFGQQLMGDFPKFLGSSVEIIISSANKVDAPNPSSFHEEPFDSSSVNLTNNVGMTVVNGLMSVGDVPIQSRRNSYVCHEWPCVFAMNQSRDSVTRGSLPTNSNGSLGSQPLTICIKHRNTGFLTLEDIENTDNYTRRTNYHPFLKVTHMYNNCILEFPPRQSSDHGNFNKKNPGYPPRVHNLRRWSLLSSNENFLKNCETCDKSLQGIDVYIYRGESSFCSIECRYWKVKAERDFAKMTRMIPTAPSSRNEKAVFLCGC